jgi:hypothetical protein
LRPLSCCFLDHQRTSFALVISTNPHNPRLMHILRNTDWR